MASITWNNNDIIWSSNSFTWDEVQLVQEIRAGGVIEDDMPWMKPEKKERLIKLILKILIIIIHFFSKLIILLFKICKIN